MNINDFSLTVIICLLLGLAIGYFIRDMTQVAQRIYRRYVKKPSHLVEIKTKHS